MISVNQLSKRYGHTLAVDRLSFQVQPGRVTGFLGPNGAGKSTTMRMILGLDTPSGGQALIDGQPYRSLRRPLRQVGSLLDASAVHGGRRAGDHLRFLAAASDLPASRVPEVLDRTGLTSVAAKRVRGFSLGMRQRLGIAAALLGDPPVLVFDEPVNGLDPDGIRWIRGLMRSLAAKGRTVFVSSHLMSEMAQTADHLIVVGRGRLLADVGLRAFVDGAGGDVLVRAERSAELSDLLREAGAHVTAEPDQALAVRGLGAERISALAGARGIAIVELTRRQPSLEDAYLRLTESEVQHQASTAEPGDLAVDRRSGR